MQLSAADIARATDGRLIGPDVMVDGVAFDSRELAPGQLFVPVVAERDGHDFIRGAVEAGAVAYLTERELVVEPATAILVADSAAAFLSIGSLARDRLPHRVIGITGSVGKTSVKDLTAAALARHYRTQANPKSFNNDLGVPYTLANAPDGVEAVVVEMGMRGFGEIERLCRIARPTIGVVTVLGEAHFGRVGGAEGVAAAKGELIAALPASGTAVLNAEQPRCLALSRLTDASILTFGGGVGDVRAEDVRLDDLARTSFRLATPWGSMHVVLRVSGVHMAVNAAAAAAAALAAGVPLERVVAGLAGASLSPWRMEMVHTAAGAVVLNDAYNANPTSMEAALRTLAALASDGRRVAILGPMAELDDDGPRRHRDMAALARSLGIDLVAVGTSDYGIEPTDDPVAKVAPLVKGDSVLVKGSRVAGLERVAAALIALEGR